MSTPWTEPFFFRLFPVVVAQLQSIYRKMGGTFAFFAHCSEERFLVHLDFRRIGSMNFENVQKVRETRTKMAKIDR